MPRRNREPLSRARIADAALSLIAEGGLSELSMRKVGGALGVEAMSLYRHVEHRDDLLDAVHALMLGEVTPAPPTDDWVEDALETARRLREVLMRRPRAVPVVATRPALTGASVDLLEDVLARVHPHVGGNDAAVAVVQTVFAFVVGHCTFHAALLEESRGPVVDPARHPRLSAAATEASSLDAHAEFAAGLAVLGAGLRARYG